MNIKKMIPFLLVLTGSITAKVNQLKKVYHHTTSSESPQIDVANVVLYFADSIIMEPRSAKNKHEFFFPQTTIQSEACKAMIEKLNEHSNKLYHAQIQQVNKPIPGIKLTISYNPNKVGLSYDQFDSIGLQKGVIFRLHNKEFINKLRTANKPLLKVAYKKKTPSIVVDCGHGGRDCGAVGCNGILEKHVCLSVGMQLAQMLQKNGMHVLLTRSNDATVSLDQRTTFANSVAADLFVSVHANSARSSHAQGIETYCLDTKQLSYVHTTMNPKEADTIQSLFNKQCKESMKCAQKIQSELIGFVNKRDINVKNRYVKRATSQVLVGTQMPAVLIELGFVSNAVEAERLGSKEYQNILARGITQGVCSYLKLKTVV